MNDKNALKITDNLHPVLLDAPDISPNPVPDRGDVAPISDFRAD